MALRGSSPDPAPVVPAAPAVADDVAGVLAAARAGGAAAFEALYRRYAPVAHGVALARVGPSDAEDVVQDVFVALHRSLTTLRDPAALASWVRSTAAHAAVDRLRRRARAGRPEPLSDVATRAAAVGDEGAALRARVLAAIQGLPEAYREALVWRLVEGLPGPEIAARTGLTPGSVRVHLHRGMAQLRAALTEDRPR
ncbi:MAG: sigma-70 family RNA polymerase sigma factor [Planctomycetes bacterium]|nr:sigma-70 family RNA polymerase sigma factor [Planctomycetota bacterium]